MKKPAKPARRKRAKPSRLNRLYSDVLYDSDPKCQHVIAHAWSGFKCVKCNGCYCF